VAGGVMHDEAVYTDGRAASRNCGFGAQLCVLLRGREIGGGCLRCEFKGQGIKQRRARKPRDPTG
jgi:hypothetical protein